MSHLRCNCGEFVRAKGRFYCHCLCERCYTHAEIVEDSMCVCVACDCKLPEDRWTNE